MKSNYERKRILLFYCISSIVLLIGTVLIFVLSAWDYSPLVPIIILEMLFAVLIYILISRSLNRAYGGIENAAEIMDELLRDEYSEIPDELEDGELGLLYSNLYKLVVKFRENNEREQSEKDFMKDMMSDISHQLKTPLASLNIFVDLMLEDRVSSEEERKDLLNESKKQLSRMEWMVLSMLKLARIEAGAVEFDREEVSLLPVLNQAVDAVRYLTDARDQTVIITPPDTDARLICDSRWLTEAIINLLKNASDYSSADGCGREINIEVESNSLFTRIYIRDQGIGISEEALPYIFKRFYRASSDVNPDSVGIGLSLTQSIIVEMGGSIKAESTPGEGTVFIITF